MFWNSKNKVENIFDDVIFKPVGDTGLFIEIGQEITETINSKVHTITNLIENQNLPFIEEVIPAYSSLLINFDPLKISFESLSLIHI